MCIIPDDPLLGEVATVHDAHLRALLIRLLYSSFVRYNPCRKHDHANVISNRRAWETRMSLEEVLISVWWQALVKVAKVIERHGQ